MKIKFLAAAGIAVCLLGGCREKEPGSYELGRMSLEQREYGQAVTYFEKAAKEEENPVRAWRGMGIVWTQQGLFEKAQKAYLKALEYTGKKDKAMQTDLYLYLADALYHQEDYQGCISTCEELLRIRKVKDGYFLRGSAYLHLGKYDNAEKDFSRVLSENGKYQDYLDIYRVYSECDLNADGGEYLEDALEAAPKSAEDYYDRGRIYYYLEEYGKAGKELKKALEKKDVRAAAYLGKVYMASGDIPKARKAYENSLEIPEMQAEAYNGLAFCAMTEKDYDNALKYIKKGLKVNNPDVEQALLFNEIVIYERQADFASARKKMNKYLEQYPADEAAVRENYFLQTR